MSELLLIFLAAGLANNLVTDHLLGAGPALVGAQRLDIALDMAFAVTGVTALIAVITWLLERLLIVPLHLEDYRLLILVVSVIGICQAARSAPGSYFPRLFDRDGRFYPLLLMNCLLLGVMLLGVQQQTGLFGALVSGAGAGLGYSLVLLGFTAINLRLAVTDLPAPFRGLPVQMITLGFVSLAFSAFTGMAS